MPIQKYLELDSNYRNRNLYPNPASFVVELSQSGTKGQLTAVDPVTYSYPQNIFSPNDIPCNSSGTTGNGLNFVYNLASGNTGSTTGSQNAPLLAASSNTIIVLIYTYSNNNVVPMPTGNGYLTGSVLQATTGTANQIRRIIDWNFLKDDGSNQFFLAYLESAFDNDILGTSNSFTVYNPSDITTSNYPFVFIPQTLSIPNYYDKYVLYNQNRQNYAKIISFNKDTHLAQLSDITNLNWNLQDVLVMRQEVPRCVGNVGVTGNSYNNINVGFTLDNTFINNFIRTYSTTGPTGAENSQVVQITGIVQNITSTGVTGTSNFQLVYNNTAVATVSPKFSSIPNTTQSYEIMAFNIDNASPFVFTGTMSAQSQPVAQQITLNSLILPNATLKAGGRIAYYPYVYVEIENKSSSSGGTKNLIYSNNPHTYKAVFKVPITDLNHPAQSPFVKLTGNGMKQTMIFKQNDDMLVSVRLPNGDLFETQSSDNQPGNLPNPLLQISLLFGMEKI